MNPYNPVTQAEQWLAWETANANATAPPATPPAPQPPAGTAVGGAGASAQQPGTTTTRPTYTPNPGGGGGTRENYAASNAADKRSFQLSTGNYLEKLPAGFTEINNGQKAVRGNEAYQKDMTTNLWSPTFVTKTDTQSLAGINRGAAQAPGMLGNVAGSLQGQAPFQPGTGQLMPGTAGMPGALESKAGITLPGMERFNLPGMGIEAEGRKSLYDNNGLNTMYANRPNGPQIQNGPGQRNGRAGNNIVFGSTSSITPQMQFPGVTASVPGTYVQGVGNRDDANRAYSVPFNIGPGGASNMNIGGSNVQVNSADKSSGMGFALTPQTPSDKFAATDFGAATGRSLNNDPALQAAQTMQLIAALSQLGGGAGAIDMLTAAERNQYSGNPSTGMGTWFANAAPGPQAAPLAPPAAAPPPAAPGQKDEEEEGGVRGYSMGGRVNSSLPGFSMGGRVNSSLPGFAVGGGVKAVNPTAASPAIDATLAGSLAGPGAGGAVETNSPTTSINPAANAIQPVQGPQNTTAIVPTPAAAAAGPAPTPTPAWTSLPQSGLDLGVLSRFNESVAKQAQQQHLRQTFNNRREAANLGAATAIQLQPGQEMPTEGLAPGAYYDISEALQSLMGDIRGSQTELAGLGNIGDPQQIMAYLSGLEQEQSPYQKAQDIKLQLAGLGQAGQGDTGGLMQQQEALKQQMGPLGTIMDAQQKRVALGERGSVESIGAQVVALQDAIEGGEALNKLMGELYEKMKQGDYQATIEWYKNVPNAAGIDNLPNMKAQLFDLKNQLGQVESRNNAIDEAERTVANLVAASGLSADQVANQMGLYGAQLDQLKQAYNAAMQGETYRQQMASLIGNKDPTAELGRLGALIGQTKTDYGNVERARQLNNRITNLAQRGAQLPGFDRGGDVTTDDHDDQNMTTGVDLGPYSPSQGYGAGGPLAPDVNEAAKGRWQDEYAGPLANVIGELNLPFGTGAFLAGPMSNRVGEGLYNQELDRLRTENEAGRYLPGMGRNTGFGKVAEFAKGGNWIAGATKNSHGQFRAKAQAAGMSTKAYASKMSDAPGRTGKQARLAKTLMGFADGGDMTTNEPIIGIGMFTGRPRFQVGEPQVPGGPPMAERLSIKPLNRPAALPMGRMSRAA